MVAKRAKEFGLKTGGNFTYVGLFTHHGDVPNPGITVKDPNTGKRTDQVWNWAMRQRIPPLIVLDSLVRFMPGDENSTDAPKAFWERIKKLNGAGCSFLILHHAGKGASTKEGRGSTDITAGCDFKYLLTKPSKGGEDGHKNLLKMDMSLLRTRYPDDSIPVKSVVDITRGVWTRETVEVTETSAAKKSNGDALREILRQNPGIGVNEFEGKAKDAKIGQAFFRKWKTEMITTGNIHVTSGPNRAQLLTWDDTVPETVAKVSLSSNLRWEDIPKVEFDFKK